MIALGDALAFALSRLRNFTPDDFARFHPSGSLGRKLLKVECGHARGDELRLAPCTATVREVFAQARTAGPPQRGGHADRQAADCAACSPTAIWPGCSEQHRDDALDRPIAEVMTPDPLTVPPGNARRRCHRTAASAQDQRVAGGGRGRLPPVGLLDVTDLIGEFPTEEPAAPVRASA